ncbi:MAG: methyltransferase domain-containing protein [Verrucomicrobiaceae bacterium]|nr:methyltransferase domain-containing protein [Verrucomicrobiaceae bacterium]
MEEPPTASIYETRKLLDEYLLFHYGSPREVLPWEFGPHEALGFPIRTVRELIDPARAIDSALDLGCAVGRSSFELAAFGAEVTGIDFSVAFIEAARTLQATGSLAYRRLDEAADSTPLVAEVPAHLPRKRVHFETGDATRLRIDLGSFDVVHAANLLCRLTHPEKLLARLPALVKPCGQLLLATPCTWLEEFTPREHWPAGPTRDWLLARLGEHFTLDHQTDMPFLIREHARKFQWSVALGTRWIRGTG